MKISYHFSAVLAIVVIAATSCSADIDNILPEESAAGGPGSVVLNAVAEQAPDTRTSLSDDCSVIWSSGDEFSLLSSGTNDRFVISAGANTANGSFTGNVSGAAPYYALYPYSEDASVEDCKLKFTLPQIQDGVNGKIGAGAIVSVASVSSLDGPVLFRNICGILRLNVTGSGSVKTIVVQDLSGAPLWGDCELALDGKQGTSDQNLTVTGGSNKLIYELKTKLALTKSTPKVFNIAVPAGSFKNGFSVAFYDADGNALGFLTAQSGDNVIERSIVLNMNQVAMPGNGESKDVLARGYYGDVFMDGSVGVSSRTTLPACPYIGYSLEYIASNGSSSLCATDTLIMRNVFEGCADDPNGVLLYPDGEPRFRIVYVNGGNARNHGEALGAKARANFKTYVDHGGSYVGSCAGAYLACTGTHSAKYEVYIGLYPGICTNCNLSDTYTGHFVEPDSPLLDYFDFGGDMYIEEVYHNGGCFMSDDDLIPGAEILLRYDYPTKPMHKQGSIWAYKANATKGRVIPCGSHPEGITSGERRDLMAAMLMYAADGNGVATTKKTLYSGTKVTMTGGSTTASKAGLGDGQYHHFKMEVPEGARNIEISLTGEKNDYDMILTLRKGDFAWRSDADFVLAQKGSTKTLRLDTLEAGTWYVGVCCTTLPASKLTNDRGCQYYKYSGTNAGILGVGYTLTSKWE